MKNETVRGRAGGLARAETLSPEKTREIARRAAIARWGEKRKKATHKGSFKNDFGIDVECYVLDDNQKTAVISKGGMNEVLGFGKVSRLGNSFVFLGGQKSLPTSGPNLQKSWKIPLFFKAYRQGRIYQRRLSSTATTLRF